MNKQTAGAIEGALSGCSSFFFFCQFVPKSSKEVTLYFLIAPPLINKKNLGANDDREDE